MVASELTFLPRKVLWLLELMDMHPSDPVLTATLMGAAAAGVVAWLVYGFFHRVVTPVVLRLAEYTDVKWDDDFFNAPLLHAVAVLMGTLALSRMLPAAVEAYPPYAGAAATVCALVNVTMVVTVINRLLITVYHVLDHHTRIRVETLKGVREMLQILVVTGGLIVAVGLLTGKSPATILTGLGAMAAVIMLVFKDSILGLVAGIQLTLNDMLRPGDWITVQSHGINGVVVHIGLTTVKVQNFDNTIVTIQPYALVSESFQNWRGMREGGARRITRTIPVDMTSVGRASEALRCRAAGEEWAAGIDLADPTLVNLTLFRRYLEHYLAGIAVVHPDRRMWMMVRELQPTAQGLPLELYLFVPTTVWTEFEAIQADITDHVLASVGDFDLKIFQMPSGADVHNILQNK